MGISLEGSCGQLASGAATPGVGEFKTAKALKNLIRPSGRLNLLLFVKSRIFSFPAQTREYPKSLPVGSMKLLLWRAGMDKTI